MAHYRVLPHSVAAPEAVTLKRWWFKLEDGDVRELPDAIEGWDYNSRLVIGADFDIDLDELSASTGLPTDAITAVASLDCPTVAERFTGRASVVDGHQAIEVELPRGRGADAISVALHLVAARASSLDSATAETRTGARLFDSDPRRVRIEGTGDRFPVEVVRFSSIGLEFAPWTIIMDFDDLNDAFMGSVRLFVNSEHPLGAAASNPSRTESSAYIMQIDTMRLLITEIAQSGMYDPTSSWDEGSVADVVGSMCTAYFNRQLDTVITLLTSDPAGFERLLYDAISFEGVNTH